MHRWLVLLMALSMGLVFQSRPALCSLTEGSVRQHFPEETPIILKSAAEAVENQLDALDRDLAEAARRFAVEMLEPGDGKLAHTVHSAA